MTSTFKRRAIVNACSAFVGITLPLTAGLWLMLGSDNDFVERIAPDSAAEAVVQRLPQVAVIGQKAGPAGTTEVFIQVPGVMNMQSVYVLSDGKTVISGFILPDMERGGVPGGQLSMPDGKPTVNVADRRENLDELLGLIRDNSQVRDEVLALANSAAQGSKNGGEPTVSERLPSPKTAPVVREHAEPQVSAPSVPSATAAPVRADDKAPLVPEIPAVSSPAVPMVSEQAGIPYPSVPVSDAAADDTNGEPKAGPGDEAMTELTIADLTGAARFGDQLKTMLFSDPEIDTIRKLTEPQDQQAAYLEYLKQRPAITQGTGPRHLYVFFDSNCPVCHQYYAQIKPKVDRGQLTVHWIPAVIFPNQRSSVTSGAQMLSLVQGGYHEQALKMLDNTMMSQGYTNVLDNHYSDEQHSRGLIDMVRGSVAMAIVKMESPLIVYEGLDGSLVTRTGIPTPGYEMEIRVQQEVSNAN